MRAGIEEAAKTSGVELQIVSASSPNDFDGAFEAMVAARTGALIILPSPMFYVNYRRLVDLAAKHRLPTMYVWREAVEAGGLMCYGADIPDLSRLAGKYVAKILKGAKPSDLPRPLILLPPRRSMIPRSAMSLSRSQCADEVIE